MSNITYHKMGNTQTLDRYGAVVDMPYIADDDGFGQMDKLYYQHQGNKLLNVTELSGGATN